MKQFKFIYISLVVFLMAGCGDTSSSTGGEDGGSSSLTFTSEASLNSFTLALQSKNIGTGEDSPYMVSYGIIDKSEVNPDSYNRYTGIENTGYESAIFSKNSGNTGSGTTVCHRDQAAGDDYVQRYQCQSRLTNGTELSDELVLFVGKTYVVYLQESFMFQDGYGMGYDEKIREIAEFTVR